MAKSIPLKTIGEIRHEMAKVYREARNGKIKINDASRFCYMLKEMGKMAELEYNVNDGKPADNWTQMQTIIGMDRNAI